MFVSTQLLERPSLKILNALYEYDDFMESVTSVVDLGCGNGEDLEWWATRATRDDIPIPLNIKCAGIDIFDRPPIIQQYSNITYQKTNFESDIYIGRDRNKFDLLWCYDSFQYCINPLQTLLNWRNNVVSENGMLILAIPQTVLMSRGRIDATQQSGCFYHYTLVNLIHMLSVTGWDCRSGFFYKEPNDSWIYSITYTGNQENFNPSSTLWYDLVDKNILPESAEKSIMAHGYLRQQDLVLPWLDKSLTWMGKQ
jgi:SAM-dependent methyltransferase